MPLLILIFIASLIIPSAFATDSSASLAFTSQKRIYKCYGTSNASIYSNNGNDYYDTEWYRCNGEKTIDGDRENTWISCQDNYFVSNIYIWYYTNTGWAGGDARRYIHRCKFRCRRITTYQPDTNCSWHNS